MIQALREALNGDISSMSIHFYIEEKQVKNLTEELELDLAFEEKNKGHIVDDGDSDGSLLQSRVSWRDEKKQELKKSASNEVER